MTQLTGIGLLRILGHVSAIVVIPILGGAVAGIIVDRILGTSPMYVLSGFGVGNLIAILGIWLYIRAHSHVDAGTGGESRDERRDGT